MPHGRKRSCFVCATKGGLLPCALLLAVHCHCAWGHVTVGILIAVAIQGEEKSYGAVAHRTLFVPAVLQEVASHLKDVTIPLDDAPLAGALFDATPSTHIFVGK